MKKIILTISLLLTNLAFAQGTVTFKGDYAYALAQELPESSIFSCDLTLVNPRCVLRTKLVRSKNGNLNFSGQFAAELNQLSASLKGITCSEFANLDNWCRVERNQGIEIQEEDSVDEHQKGAGSNSSKYGTPILRDF